MRARQFCDRVLAYAYRNAVWPLMPRRRRLLYGGVAVDRWLKWFDERLPTTYTPHFGHDLPEYEDALLAGIRAEVRPGDRVVVAGGGLGVTVIHAARAVGPGGTVVCLEAARERVLDVLAVAEREGVAGRVSVRHAVVGDARSVWGEASAEVVAAEALPPCDVLELDCEGAELDLIRRMTIRPRVVLVETHGVFGAPTADVEAALREAGYTVRLLGVAESRLRDACEQNDIHVLAATREAVAPD